MHNIIPCIQLYTQLDQLRQQPGKYAPPFVRLCVLYAKLDQIMSWRQNCENCNKTNLISFEHTLRIIHIGIHHGGQLMLVLLVSEVVVVRF